MKHQVIRAFIDGQTNKPYAVGDVYETDNETRAADLQQQGFLFRPKPEKKTKAKPADADEKK